MSVVRLVLSDLTFGTRRKFRCEMLSCGTGATRRGGSCILILVFPVAASDTSGRLVYKF